MGFIEIWLLILIFLRICIPVIVHKGIIKGIRYRKIAGGLGLLLVPISIWSICNLFYSGSSSFKEFLFIFGLILSPVFVYYNACKKLSKLGTSPMRYEDLSIEQKVLIGSMHTDLFIFVTFFFIFVLHVS